MPFRQHAQGPLAHQSVPVVWQSVLVQAPFQQRVQAQLIFTNLSVTITTSGRPVFIGLTNDLSAAPQISYLEASRTGQAAQANFRLLRDGTAIAEEELDIFSQAVASVIIQFL